MLVRRYEQLSKIPAPTLRPIPQRPQETFLGLVPPKSEMRLMGSGNSVKWYDRHKHKGSGLLKQEFKGEKHIPLVTPKGIKLGQYCGPGTHLDARERRGDKGLNYTDAQCKKHDEAYDRIQKSNVPKKEKGKMVRKADNFLIKALKKHKGINPKIVSTGMKAKKIAEDIGILDRSKYVGGGAEKLLPHELLKYHLFKKSKRKQKS